MRKMKSFACRYIVANGNVKFVNILAMNYDTAVRKFLRYVERSREALDGYEIKEVQAYV